MKFASEDVSLFHVNGYNLIGASTNIGINVEAEVKDSTTLGKSWREFLATGLKMGEVTQDGFLDEAPWDAGESEFVNPQLYAERLWKASLGVSHVGMIALESGVLGQGFTGFKGLLHTKHERKDQVGDIVGASVTYQVSGQFEDGVIVKLMDEDIVDDGDTEAADIHDVLTPSPVGYHSAYVEVESIELGDATSLLLQLRHSDDGIAWSDVTGVAVDDFSPITERGAERININGISLKDYVAVAWEWEGGASAESVARFAVGVTRNQGRP